MIAAIAKQWEAGDHSRTRWQQDKVHPQSLRRLLLQRTAIVRSEVHGHSLEMAATAADTNIAAPAAS